MRESDATTAPAIVRYGKWLSLAAAAFLTAHGEYELLVQVGITPALAWLGPVGLDVYAGCAFAARARTDVRIALALMIACQALSHLLAIALIPRHWALVIAVSAVAPIVCWRVHHLEDKVPAAPASSTEPSLAPIVETVEPAPVPAAATTRVLPVPRESARRSREQTRAVLLDFLATNPDATQRQLAAHAGITARWARAVLKPATA